MIELAGMSLTVEQALLGSCTNARVEDIAVAAGMLCGRKVHADVRMIVTAASSEVWRDCARLGYWEILADAGAIVTTASCGAFSGGDGGWHTAHGIPHMAYRTWHTAWPEPPPELQAGRGNRRLPPGRTSDQLLYGADDGIRTRDPHLGKVMLYQLSHVRSGIRVAESTVTSPGVTPTCGWSRCRARAGTELRGRATRPRRCRPGRAGLPGVLGITDTTRTAAEGESQGTGVAEYLGPAAGEPRLGQALVEERRRRLGLLVGLTGRRPQTLNDGITERGHHSTTGIRRQRLCQDGLSIAAGPG